MGETGWTGEPRVEVGVARLDGGSTLRSVQNEQFAATSRFTVMEIEKG